MPVEQAPIGEGGVRVLHSRASAFRNAGTAKRWGPAYPESHQAVWTLFLERGPAYPESHQAVRTLSTARKALWPWWKLGLFLGLLGGLGYLAFG